MPQRSIAVRVGAFIVSMILVALGLTACTGGENNAIVTPEETPTPSATLSPVRITAAESVWGLLAAQIGGTHVEVTSIMDSTITDTMVFAPTADQKTLIAEADMVLVTGAGYDPWAVEQTSREQSIVSAASSIGAGSGDNPYLWYSRDVRKAVAESISDALTKLRPDWADDFTRNLEKWQREENRLETRIDKLAASFPGDVSYVAFTPVGYYLFSELKMTNVTPEAYSLTVLKGQSPDSSARAAFSEALDVADFAVSDTQHPVDGMNAVEARAESLEIPLVAIPELPDAEGTTVTAWLSDIVNALDSALESLQESATPSPSPTVSPSVSNDSTSAGASDESSGLAAADDETAESASSASSSLSASPVA